MSMKSLFLFTARRRSTGYTTKRWPQWLAGSNPRRKGAQTCKCMNISLICLLFASCGMIHVFYLYLNSLGGNVKSRESTKQWGDNGRNGWCTGQGIAGAIPCHSFRLWQQCRRRWRGGWWLGRLKCYRNSQRLVNAPSFPSEQYFKLLERKFLDARLKVNCSILEFSSLIKLRAFQKIW